MQSIWLDFQIFSKKTKNIEEYECLHATLQEMKLLNNKAA